MSIISVYEGKEFLEKARDVIKRMKPKYKCSLKYLKTTLSSEKKASASNTIIAFGEFYSHETDDIDIVLKISFQSIQSKGTEYCDMLCVERRIYDEVIPKLLEYTPNIVDVYGVVTCENFWTTIGYQLMKKDTTFSKSVLREMAKEPNTINQIIRTLLAVKNDDPNYKKYENYIILAKEAARIKKSLAYDLNTANFIILEKLQNKSLNDRMDEFAEEEDPEVFFAVLFQIFYTLHIFNIAKFKHNDLHDGNIMIEKSDKIYEIIYEVDGKFFKIRSHYLVKIYDFDRSVVNCNTKDKKHRLCNVDLDLQKKCECIGECNEPNTKYDTFTITSILHDKSKYAIKFYESRKIKHKRTMYFVYEFTNFIVRDSRYFGAKWGFNYRLCKLSSSRNPNCLGDNYCKGNYEPSDKEILNTTDILNSKYFKPFRIRDEHEISRIKEGKKYYSSKPK